MDKLLIPSCQGIVVNNMLDKFFSSISLHTIAMISLLEMSIIFVQLASCGESKTILAYEPCKTSKSMCVSQIFKLL